MELVYWLTVFKHETKRIIKIELQAPIQISCNMENGLFNAIHSIFITLNVSFRKWTVFYDSLLTFDQ